MRKDKRAREIMGTGPEGKAIVTAVLAARRKVRADRHEWQRPTRFSTIQCRMWLPFNETKATQAASRLLVLGGGRMEYIKLIKLLYFLDRASLLKWGRPVTTDRYVSMANGPVVRRIYDLISEPPAQEVESFWRRHISPPSKYVVRLLREAGSTELSPAEDKLICSVFKKYGSKHWTDLISISHTFKEWHDPEKRRVTEIAIRDILKAGNKADSEIEEIERELESLAVVERMISPE